MDNTFLKLTGGTLNGNLKIGNVTIYSNGTDGGTNSISLGNDATIGDCNVAGSIGIKATTGSNAGIMFLNPSNVNIGDLQSINGTLKFNNNTVWHAGNDGTGSGLDADLLDGLQYVKYLPYGCYNNTLGILVTTEIPATSDAMFVIKIIGNDYSDNPKGINTTIQFYNYSSGAIS